MEDIIPRPELKKAVDLAGIPDAFEALPLSTPEHMAQFYVETMEARTGDPDESPIFDIEAACRSPREKNAMLLMGHRGCGKSTELNDMKLRLEKEKRIVLMIQCDEELTLDSNPEYSDLLILMADRLLKKARELGVLIRPGTAKTIQTFWNLGERVTDTVSEADMELSGGVEAASPGLMDAVIKLFAKLTTDLKYNETVRTTYTERMTQNYDHWRTVLRQLSDGIYRKTGKQPIVIFEGLDHMDQAEGEHVFFNHPGKLSDVNFPVIYTFPIALCYDKRFPAIEHDFRLVSVFPVLKLHNNDRTLSDFPDGWRKLREIVARRAEPGLIDPDALELMIEKTGGSLRDLFKVIRTASQRAAHRAYRTGNEHERITIQDAQRALTRMKSDMARLIEGDDHKFLVEICNGKRTEIEDRDTLLKMLLARTVLEYNGARWCDVHPLVKDYLKELGYVT